MTPPFKMTDTTLSPELLADLKAKLDDEIAVAAAESDASPMERFVAEALCSDDAKAKGLVDRVWIVSLPDARKAIAAVAEWNRRALSSTPAIPDELLADLKAKALAATPGPWHYRPDQYDDWGWVRGPVIDRTEVEGGPYQYAVARGMLGGSQPFGFENECRRQGVDPYGPNAQFIAAANPSTILSLIAEIERRPVAQEGVVVPEAVCSRENCDGTYHYKRDISGHYRVLAHPAAAPSPAPSEGVKP